MPKSYRPQYGIAAIVLVLMAVIIVGIVSVVLYTLGVVKLPGKSIPKDTKSASDVQVELKKEYENPFDKSTQYQNPFSDYQNPFDQLK